MAFGSTLKDAPNGAFFIRAVLTVGAFFIRRFVNTYGAVSNLFRKSFMPKIPETAPQVLSNEEPLCAT
jgi:hypothetical protein